MEGKEHTYLSYSVEDFIEDEHFHNWVLQPNTESDTFWQQFLTAHPQKERSIQEARTFIQSLQGAQSSETNSIEQQQAIDKILAALPAASTHVVMKPRKYNYLVGIAASLALLLTAAYLFFNIGDFSSERLVVKTAFGDNKAVTLEDSTIITLNGNSSIKKTGARTVSLTKGEAHFNVTKQIDSAKFVVATKNSILTVLGTSFNVYERDDSLSVHLETGKLKITLNDSSKDTTVFYIVPGDLFTYNAETKKASVENNTTVRYSSWMDGDYIFERTSIRQILTILQNTYGIDIEASEQLLDKTMTGKVPTHDIDLMLELIANAVGAEVTSKDKKYYME